jgi:hypothetical protein
VAVALGVVIAAAAIVPALRALGGSAAPKAAQSQSCRTRLLRDWSDGRIDGTYPVSCYRLLLKSLPPDLAVYSSAPDDIARALSATISQRGAQKISGHHGAPSVRKIESAR